MAMSGRYVTEVTLKVPAEKYYKNWKSENQVYSIAAGHRVQGFSGDSDSYGASFILWDYTCNGKQEVFKEKREYNDKTMAVTVRGIEGNVMKELKVYDIIFKVIPKSEESCVCKITMIWEKRKEESPEPINYLKFVENLAVDVADHILKG